MEKTLEQAFCPPLCLLFEAFLLAWEKQPQAPSAEFLLSVRQGQHSNQSAGDRHTAQTEKTVPKTAFHLFYSLLPIGATEGRNSLTMSEGWNVDSQQRWDAGVGFYFRSYLTRSYNSLRWAPQPLTWPWWCRSDKRWGRLDSSELENRDKRSDDGQQVTSDVWHSEQQSSLCVFGGCNFRVWCSFFFCVSWKCFNNLWSDVILILNRALSSRWRSRVSQWRNPQSEIKEIVYFNFIFYIQLQGYSQLWHVT